MANIDDRRFWRRQLEEVRLQLEEAGFGVAESNSPTDQSLRRLDIVSAPPNTKFGRFLERRGTEPSWWRGNITFHFDPSVDGSLGGSCTWGSGCEINLPADDWAEIASTGTLSPMGVHEKGHALRYLRFDSRQKATPLDAILLAEGPSRYKRSFQGDEIRAYLRQAKRHLSRAIRSLERADPKSCEVQLAGVRHCLTLLAGLSNATIRTIEELVPNSEALLQIDDWQEIGPHLDVVADEEFVYVGLSDDRMGEDDSFLIFPQNREPQSLQDTTQLMLDLHRMAYSHHTSARLGLQAMQSKGLNELLERRDSENATRFLLSVRGVLSKVANQTHSDGNAWVDSIEMAQTVLEDALVDRGLLTESEGFWESANSESE